jgi:DNA-binding response OmpR family regulator
MNQIQKQILLVEDEENFGSLLQNYLRLSGHKVDWVKDGTTGYSTFVSGKYDVCIFDIMMPYMDGFQLTEKIRARGSQTPIIFLTAKKMREDMIKGYKAGADDYLNKPFDIEILLLKLEAIFSRDTINEPHESKFSIGQFLYEVNPRSLTINGDSKKLSPKEGALLEMLCTHINDVLPREKALIEIWKEDNYFTTRSMDVYIAKLRKHLKEDESVRIENVHSSGYGLYVTCT